MSVIFGTHWNYKIQELIAMRDCKLNDDNKGQLGLVSDVVAVEGNGVAKAYRIANSLGAVRKGPQEDDLVVEACKDWRWGTLEVGDVGVEKDRLEVGMK